MPIEITAKIRNKDRLFQKLKQTAPDVTDEVVAENLKLAEEMVGTARGFAPVGNGDLRNSIVATPGGQAAPSYSQPGGTQSVPEGSVLVTAGNSRVRTAHIVEFGSRPHAIAPKTRSILAFTGKDGERAFAPVVAHPGAQAHPFFWPAYRLIRSRLRRRMSTAVRRALKKATT